MSTGAEVKVKDHVRDGGSPVVWEIRYMDDEYIFMTGVGFRSGPEDVFGIVRTVGRRTFDRDYDWEIISSGT